MIIDEEKLFAKSVEEISFDKSLMITSLPEVEYGRSKEIKDGLDIKRLTGKDMGIKFVDINGYMALNINGNKKSISAYPDALMINVLKTKISDPKNIYIAIKPDINDSSLIHEIAHVINYLCGFDLLPAFIRALAFEFAIPLEHLEHPHEFGYWFDYLKRRFNVIPDAEDTIICILYENNMLIKSEDIKKQNKKYLKEKSDNIIKFLSENSEKIYSKIKNLPGYIAPS